MSSSVADAGWTVTVAANAPGLVAAALTRGRQVCELRCDHGATGAVGVQVLFIAEPDRAVEVRMSARKVGADRHEVAAAAAGLVTDAGLWWPTVADVEDTYREALRLLVAGAASRLGRDVRDAADDQGPWDVLPDPLPRLVGWVLSGDLRVLPCPHLAAARQVRAQLTSADPPAETFDRAAEIAGDDWVATALTARWTPPSG